MIVVFQEEPGFELKSDSTQSGVHIIFTNTVTCCNSIKVCC